MLAKRPVNLTDIACARITLNLASPYSNESESLRARTFNFERNNPSRIRFLRLPDLPDIPITSTKDRHSYARILSNPMTRVAIGCRHLGRPLRTLLNNRNIRKVRKDEASLALEISSAIPGDDFHELNYKLANT